MNELSNIKFWKNILFNADSFLIEINPLKRLGVPVQNAWEGYKSNTNPKITYVKLCLSLQNKLILGLL
jgi:hypothetical protein